MYVDTELRIVAFLLYEGYFIYNVITVTVQQAKNRDRIFLRSKC